MKETLDLTKIVPLLPKCEFYHFFKIHIGCKDSMKREISEIVANNRKLPIKKAVNIRNFTVKEVKKFIIDNDLQTYFVA